MNPGNKIGKREVYYKQLEDGIAEMEAAIHGLRAEILALIEQKETLLKLNELLKVELKGWL